MTKKKTDTPCYAHMSHGGPIICELKTGHKGMHRRTGDCGNADNPVPYVIKWHGDFRISDNQLRSRLNETKKL
jgi:hypothetical protein